MADSARAYSAYSGRASSCCEEAGSLLDAPAEVTCLASTDDVAAALTSTPAHAHLVRPARPGPARLARISHLHACPRCAAPFQLVPVAQRSAAAIGKGKALGIGIDFDPLNKP